MIKRIITGFILILIAILAISFGGSLFLAWILLFGLSAYYELMRMSVPTLKTPIIIMSLAVLGGLMSLFSILKPSEKMYLIWMGFSVLLLSVFMLEIIKKKLFFQSNTIFVLSRCFLLFAMTCPYFFWIRFMDNGLSLTFLLLLLIAVSDSSAYFGGKFFGSHQLSSLSPNKTIEGAAFSVLGSTSVAMISTFYFPIPLWQGVLIGLCVSVFAQLGDLHESLTKRFYNCKDSSDILPGHGGFYDRLDGYIFAMPIFFILISVLQYV